MDSAGPASPLLAGKTVLVTRPLHQADELTKLLEAAGAAVLLIPTIEIQPPVDTAPLDEALRHLRRYQWVIFTSANAVQRVFARAAEIGLGEFASDLAAAQIAAVGPATQAALAVEGCRVDLVPREYVAESVVEAFQGLPIEGARVLLPRAAAARDVVPEALAARGAQVDAVEAYCSGIPTTSAQAVAEWAAQGKPVDWVTFTSGSTVKNFLAMGGSALLAGSRIASIGPITTEVAQKHGLRVDAEASEHTASGLVEAILRAAAPQTRPHR